MTKRIREETGDGGQDISGGNVFEPVGLDAGNMKRHEEVPNAASGFVCTADASGNTLSINPAGRRLLGVGEDEDLSGVHISHYHPEWASEVILREGIPAAARYGTWEAETALLSRDGREILVSQVIVAHKAESGEVEYFSTTARELTGYRRTDRELRDAEIFARSVLDGLSAHVAVLDGTGTIVATNKAWRDFAASNGASVTAGVAEGANYLAVCDKAHREGSDEARAFAEGIRSVISDRKNLFELEYPCHSPHEKRWFVGRVTRFPDAGPSRVVVAHENVTGRRLAEEELRTRARQQRAVASLGRRALSISVSVLMEEVVARVAETLEVRYCKVLELLPGGDELLLAAGVGWDEGLVGLATVSSNSDSQAGYTLLSDEPVVVNDLRTEGRFSGSPLLREHGVVSSMTTIIRGRQGPFGVLGAHDEKPRNFTDDDVHFLRAVANVLAAAIERERVEQALQDVREAERRRMARDLHDGAVQDITYAIAEVQLAQIISGKPVTDNRLGNVDVRLGKAAEALLRAGQELREAVYDLHPVNAKDQPFDEAVEEVLAVARRMKPELLTEISVDKRFSDSLPDSMSGELLRILQEAVTNARKHSEAEVVRVCLKVEGGEIRAEVFDNGEGFDPDTASGGLGRTSMLERAAALGGTLAIESSPGKGTRVIFRVVPDHASP